MLAFRSYSLVISMALNSKGVGYASIYDPASKELTMLAILTAGLEEEIETEISQGSPYFEPGPLVDYDIMTTARSATVTVEMEQVTPQALGLMGYNQAEANKTFKVPVPSRHLIPTNGVLTITGLVEDEPIAVTEISNAGLRKFKQLEAPATPDVGEYVVTDNTVTFDDDDAGKIIQLRRMEEISTLVIGGTSEISPFVDVEIYTQYELTKGLRRAFWVPRATSPNGATISFAAAGDAISREFTALVDSERGFVLPYVDYEIPAAPM